MEGRRYRVYCAGPLFNEREREEMRLIADALSEAGYDTFLPQRDGLELTKCIEELKQNGFADDQATELMCQAIFALDVYQVLEGCHVVVANLNGRVPDEGTVSEAAIAWSRGKPVIGYKADSRTAFAGQDNPLVVGLFDFELCRSPQEVAAQVERKLRNIDSFDRQRDEREEEIFASLQLGQAIWGELQSNRGIEGVVEVLSQHGSAVEKAG